MTKVFGIWILSNLLHSTIFFSKEFNEVALIKSITDRKHKNLATMSCDDVINESRNRFACHD